jgi:hypothetical protein
MSWYMYYQTYHQKPLVSGYLGRQPDRLFEPERTMPFVRRFFVPNWDAYFAGEGERLIDWPSMDQIAAEGWPEDIRNAPALLADQGIQHVIVHRDPERPGFLEAAGLLLHQSLGTPIQTDADILLFEVPPSPRRIQGEPAGLDYAPLSYGDSFGEPALCQHTVGHALDLDPTTGGVVTATLPLTGTWHLQGIVKGGTAGEVKLALDKRELGLEPLHLFDDFYAFQLQVDLAAGDHTLRIVGPQPDRTSQRDPNSGLCLMNLAFSLQKPVVDSPTAPLTRFVDDSGSRLDLLEAVVLPSAEKRADGTPRLVTIWSEPEPGAGYGQPSEPPTLFVHLTDRQGTIERQADHTLGANSVWIPGNGGPGYLLDVVELPLAGLAADQTEIRLGLWYPGPQTYYWTLDPDQLDNAARFTAGTVAELRR